MSGISFKHSGNAGDILAAIPAMNEYYNKTKKKILLYLVIGQKAIYYQGATHPIKDDDGEMVMLNKYMFDMIKPLLLCQECIEDIREYNEEEIQVDLDMIRDTFVNMPNGSINRWYFYVYPDLSTDLTVKWITISDTDKDIAKNKIIISRTQRYTNESINYSFLKEYEKNIVFAGTKLEHEIFCYKQNLSIPLLIVNDFLELAQGIKQSKLHLSNQTMAFQISEGLKHPRVVELCYFAPNVIPHGENAFDFYNQKAVEYYVHYLFNKQ